MNDRGLTLIELMIAMVIGAIVMGAAVSVFFSMQSASQGVDLRSAMAANARGAMYLIEESIRMMGFNPEGDMSPGQLMDPADPYKCCARPGVLRFRRNDLDRPFDDTADKVVGIGLNKSDDPDRDGIARKGVSGLVIGGQRAADHIAGLRFAYAFDADGDGAVDVSNNGNVKWAIDADGDGGLDTLLDTNDDGSIDAADAAAGGNMGSDTVDISRIRAVRVWLLVRSEHPVKNPAAGAVFDMGGIRHEPKNRYAHTLLTTTVRCRNMF